MNVTTLANKSQMHWTEKVMERKWRGKFNMNALLRGVWNVSPANFRIVFPQQIPRAGRPSLKLRKRKYYFRNESRSRNVTPTLIVMRIVAKFNKFSVHCLPSKLTRLKGNTPHFNCQTSSAEITTPSHHISDPIDFHWHGPPRFYATKGFSKTDFGILFHCTQ